MKFEEIKEEILKVYNAAKDENISEIESIKQTFKIHNTYDYSYFSIDELINNSNRLNKIAGKLATSCQDKCEGFQNLEAGQAKFMGAGLFYLYKIYLTAQCLLLIYADHLFQKYDFPYEYEIKSSIDMLSCTEHNEYPTLELNITNLGELYTLSLIFDKADFSLLEEDPSEIIMTQLQDLNVEVTLSLNFKRGPKVQMDRKEVINLSELGTWLKKVTTTLKEINS